MVDTAEIGFDLALARILLFISRGSAVRGGWRARHVCLPREPQDRVSGFHEGTELYRTLEEMDRYECS